MSPETSSPPRKILVICLRRLGDVLLATPLIRSLRRAYPQATIDALVFASTVAALDGNPDLDRVIGWPARAGLGDTLRIAGPLFRAYDLACVVTASDRAQFLGAWAAAMRVVNVLPEFPRPWLNHRRVICAPEALHTVVQGLRLANLLGITPVPTLVPPHAADTARVEPRLGADWSTRRFAVVHPAPMFRYKAWTFDGWLALIESLRDRGLDVVLSGGPDAGEQALATRLMQASRRRSEPRLASVAGALSLAELARVLQCAAIFVGPDTSVTHLSSACGTPTVALFGPSSPVAWGPWPQGWSGPGDSPWSLTAACQTIGKVTILQGTQGRFGDCIPCRLEGCERHLESVSDCLETLPVRRVVEAVDGLLGDARRSREPGVV